MKTLNVPSEFLAKFKFDPRKIGMIGCEREFFLTNIHGEIKPLAVKALEILPCGKMSIYSYELSACQLEAHIGPVEIDDFYGALMNVHVPMIQELLNHGIGADFRTVGPKDIPLDIYPDPSGRYQKITKEMPEEILRAACRVTGTHFHVGMPDHETALTVYNEVIKDFEYFRSIGNLSNGKRMSIYHTMAKDNIPRHYNDWEELHDYYSKNGYQDDPRRCWHLIRISAHGTIEFRMFDNTNDLDLVYTWARKCSVACKKVLARLNLIEDLL